MPGQRRVVITGMGAVSPIGTGMDPIAAALRAGRSGIAYDAEFERYGFVSRVSGRAEVDPLSPPAVRRVQKTSTNLSLGALHASWQALENAGIPWESVRGTDLPVIIGAGSGSTRANFDALHTVDTLRERAESEGRRDFVSTKRVNPFTVAYSMGSTAAGNVSVALGTRGESFAISSACSTGAHAIALGCLLIRAGRAQRALVGAAEEIDWTRAAAFDAMHALSRGYNDDPLRASRPFDAKRDGFVAAGGSGIVLLEDLDAAVARGATILAEVLGYGSTSDGSDMVAPLPEGAEQAMRQALADAGIDAAEVDYVNAHATSTPTGDPSEAAAMRAVFGTRQPWISSTKSLTGHSLASAGSLEAIYTVLMLRGGFLAPNLNLETVDDTCGHLRIVTDANNACEARTALSSSFGFGGTNCCLALRRWDA